MDLGIRIDETLKQPLDELIDGLTDLAGEPSDLLCERVL
jgi:hypothetical protein